MKKIIAITLSVMLVFSMQNFCFADNGNGFYTAKKVSYPIYINGKLQECTQPIVVVEGRTYLSLRDLSNLLNISTEWDGNMQSIFIDTTTRQEPAQSKYNQLGTKTIYRAKTENFSIYINGTKSIPTNIKLTIDGRTYLSVRDLATMLNIPLTWNEEMQAIFISLAETSHLNHPFNNVNVPSDKIRLLSDHKIKHMDFTQEELNYILRDTLTQKEQNLYNEINALRKQNGLPALALSMELTKVARVHVLDSKKNSPKNLTDPSGEKGNLHSWSVSEHWSGGAYTSDHKYAEMMWNKPTELSNYLSRGYEIAAWSSIDLSPKEAVDLWNSSTEHRNVILGNENWDTLSTFGVGIDGSYAFAWFGE